MTTTYTAEQIEAIGGRRWSKNDGTLRVYINQDVWTGMVGLNVNHYKTGNISSATLQGELISNSQARRLLAITVYWQDGQIFITRDAELADDIRDAIAEQVAKLPAGNALEDREPAGSDLPADVTGVVTRADQIKPGMTVRHVAPEFVGLWRTIATVEHRAGRVILRDIHGKSYARGVAPSERFEVAADKENTPAEQVTAQRAAGRTVRQIAEMVGVSVSTIYRWVRGVCSPRPTNAAALAALA